MVLPCPGLERWFRRLPWSVILKAVETSRKINRLVFLCPSPDAGHPSGQPRIITRTKKWIKKNSSCPLHPAMLKLSSHHPFEHLAQEWNNWDWSTVIEISRVKCTTTYFKAGITITSLREALSTSWSHSVSPPPPSRFNYPRKASVIWAQCHPQSSKDSVHILRLNKLKSIPNSWTS